MQAWLEQCENWLSRQYSSVLGQDDGTVNLRWVSGESLSRVIEKNDANGLVVEDGDIGWLLFVLPYEPSQLDPQINQALGLRSRLLRESNYTGDMKPGANEDESSTWRVGLVWLVEDNKWNEWQSHILELRRESGAVEELSVDAIKVIQGDVNAALDAHGLPRLLLHTRALLSQSASESETWLSADEQVSAELDGFSQEFENSRSRRFARNLEEFAGSIKPTKIRATPAKVREFHRFRVNNFRNLENIEIVANGSEEANVNAIVMFGPNGTGKTSLAEAITLAAFQTSPRLETFLDDRDLGKATAQTYLNDYLTPMMKTGDSVVEPSFAWGGGDDYSLKPFEINTGEESKRRFDGVVLNQEDSIVFSDLPREKLAEQVLRGYSHLADELSSWISKEENIVKEVKIIFTRKHGLNSSISRSSTAYNRLAKNLLAEQLQRPSTEYIEWMRFITSLPNEVSENASQLVGDWKIYQESLVDRLADNIAKLQGIGASRSDITEVILDKLKEFDDLADRSITFKEIFEEKITGLREHLDIALTQIDSWGIWLSSQQDSPQKLETDSQSIQHEIEQLSKERSELEVNGKALRERLNLLDKAKLFLESHWAKDHPDTCPVCDSNVVDREGIERVVFSLQEETNHSVQGLRARYMEIQKQQAVLDEKLKASGVAACPIAVDDQVRLKELVSPFLPPGQKLENLLVDPQLRGLLKDDLSRMQVLPNVPKSYADSVKEADRMAGQFVDLANEADKALEDPQAIAEVRKAFELKLETIMKEHLPSTIGKVWREITMTLTTASWLLPDHPNLKIEKRGKSLSVQASESGRFIRYVYNSAERHVLGLAWFFTYYIAKRRFEEAWILLDDPAQEMDQPSFRELVRFWETLLRLHKRKNRPFTMLVALHQEERALDTTRATNGQLYVLGWRKEQKDSGPQPSVKKVVLLAPGYHPLIPEEMFCES